MPRYVALVNWTEEGIRKYKDTVDRAEAVRDLAKQMGGAIDSLYWTQGAYDLVVTSEFPDEESAAAFALKVGSQGNVRTTTMRAFDAEEMRDIISKAG